MNHDVTVLREGVRACAARCSCGWRGQDRWLHLEAVGDGARHEESTEYAKLRRIQGAKCAAARKKARSKA